jgi:hypothetical protein
MLRSACEVHVELAPMRREMIRYAVCREDKEGSAAIIDHKSRRQQKCDARHHLAM